MVKQELQVLPVKLELLVALVFQEVLQIQEQPVALVLLVKLVILVALVLLVLLVFLVINF